MVRFMIKTMKKQTKNNEGSSDSPGPSKLLVKVIFNPEAQDLSSWIQSAIVEFMGVYLENTHFDDGKICISALFDKVKDGEDYFKMFQNTHLGVEKEIII